MARPRRRLVTGQDLVEEALMMGLRLAEGIDRALFASVAGADPVAALGEASSRRWSRPASSRSTRRTSRPRPPAASG